MWTFAGFRDILPPKLPSVAGCYLFTLCGNLNRPAPFSCFVLWAFPICSGPVSCDTVGLAVPSLRIACGGAGLTMDVVWGC
eukprot:m.164250 g.164250  ORF g.164250 m.164250 type:complete len:81 (+) comp14652_c0_seq2:233-475(+)